MARRAQQYRYFYSWQAGFLPVAKKNCLLIFGTGFQMTCYMMNYMDISGSGISQLAYQAGPLTVFDTLPTVI